VLGAIVSLLILLMITAFGSYKAYVLITRNNTTVSLKSFQRDLDVAGSYTPGASGFDMAFGIGVDLDPSIGSYLVTQT
jgi:hypothetical protein